MAFRRKGKAESANDVLFDAAKIDLVALAPDRSRIELYIVADAPWTGSDAQISSLQAKIHAYVGFAIDGQMAQAYPDAAALPWHIVIDCQSGAPDPRTADVLARTIEPVRGYGGDLAVRT